MNFKIVHIVVKITKTLHKYVTMVTEWVHFDLCEFDDMLSMNSKEKLSK